MKRATHISGIIAAMAGMHAAIDPLWGAPDFESAPRYRKGFNRLSQKKRRQRARWS